MRRTKDQSNETRSAILMAAQEAFRENGVAPSSIEAIARRAKVTRGAVHWHFGSKENLIAEVFAPLRFSLDYILLGKPGAITERNSLRSLEDFVLHCIFELTSNPHAKLVGLALRSYCCERIAFHPQHIAETWQRFGEEIATSLRNAGTSGELSPKWCPVTARATLMPIIIGIIVEWIEATDFSRDEAVRTVKSLFCSFRDASIT